MSPTHLEPILHDWTTPDALDDEAPSTATARELALTIGRLDLDDLRRHHLQLALAVAELSAGAGVPWPWTADDPTVALVRAVAKLSIVAPDVVGDAAGQLVDRLRVG